MTKSAVQKREWPIILIAFLFMFFFGRILGPFSVVTQVGSNALGVFIGVILLTVFTSQSTLAAILGIIAMVYSGSLTSSAAVSSWMGGSTVPQLIFVSALCVALKEAGVIDVLVRKLLSIKALRGRPVALLFRVLIVAIRSVPFLIYGLIFIRVSGPGAFTGVLTLAVCSIGLLSKRFTEAIESLDFRAYDALRAMGVSLLPRIRYAVLPQLGPAFSSAVLYRFDVNIREASVLGLVGAGGIGAPLIFAMNQYAWNDVSAIFLGFVLLVWLIDAGSARLRTRRAAAPGNKT